MEFIENLRCPLTKNPLEVVSKGDFSRLNIPQNIGNFGALDAGLVEQSGHYFYPVFDGIIVLHEQYACYIGEGEDTRSTLSHDKQRVFDYYNEVNYAIRDSLKIYEDSPKWVDYRVVSADYIRRSFSRALLFFPPTGKYLLDIASGPIGLPQYMDLADGYAWRICVDISINALVQAKMNIERAGKKGIFICGDITNIPIRDNTCDTVLSQHTLYHIPKAEQYTAVNEMYRVAKKDAKIVIIYSWFYHSWFMNITLNVVQLYRILRHFAGKAYVNMVQSKPRLYFFPHSPRWFKKSFPFSQDIEFYCWRSVNKYFLDLYIHRRLWGKQILKGLMKIEDRHPKFMSLFGDYPAIIIKKK